MGVDLKQARGVEPLMALWKISDVTSPAFPSVPSLPTAQVEPAHP